eukprot:CAMPEP_0174717218 /NCGR_PEP_ID=MMETSP1094-20130205/26197_1 /TAXON_ID=156173 /ORGANISM="Chrysochromulina brevifilum, Strain UTEX LB 985" /LENGTH=321 /DNA_ID=CAMNT_0015917123 /DNA_START=62 /DNA_END=1027 /DNA_ORIENTATION=-
MATVATIGFGAAAFGLFSSVLGVHRVPEGHVAVYYRGGALLKTTSGAGFRTMAPYITSVKFVQTTVQTDKVTDIPCGTSSGTVISFERIEVVNQLRAEAVYDTVRNYTVDYDKTWIYDKIHHEINQICSRSSLEEMYITKFDTLDETLRDALQADINQHAPGINILAIRVTKPRIPASIARHYEEIESERTKLKVAEQTQHLVEKQANTERTRALIEADKLAAVEAVQLERKLKLKENEQKVALIDAEMHLAKAKAEADAEFYRAEKLAEANSKMYTPQYLQLEAVRALANNTKVFWGEKLPSLYLDGATLVGGGTTVAGT